MSDLAASHDCKKPGCVREAATMRGRYAGLCDEHKREASQQSATATRVESNSGFEGKLLELRSLAKRADKARAKARQLTTAALAKKDEADALGEQFRALMAKLSYSEGDPDAS